MDENGIITIGDNKIHIRDLYFEIFRKGMKAHTDMNNDDSLQIAFDYWMKEKLGEL